MADSPIWSWNMGKPHERLLQNNNDCKPSKFQSSRCDLEVFASYAHDRLNLKILNKPKFDINTSPLSKYKRIYKSSSFFFCICRSPFTTILTSAFLKKEYPSKTVWIVDEQNARDRCVSIRFEWPHHICLIYVLDHSSHCLRVSFFLRFFLIRFQSLCEFEKQKKSRGNIFVNGLIDVPTNQ